MDTNGHTNLSEDYVSFEVAKLLKEKGFDEYCLKNYWSDKELHNWKWELSYNKNSDANSNTRRYAAPTLQMTLKWLREVHNIHIEIRYMPDQFTDEPTYKAMIWNMNTEIGTPLSPDVSYTYFETCCEAALKYTLENLI